MLQTETMDDLISLNKASILAECSYDAVKRAAETGEIPLYQQRGRRVVSQRDVIKWSTPEPVPVQTAAEG